MLYKKLSSVVPLLLLISINIVAQHANPNAADNHDAKGKVIIEKFLAPSLQGNHAGNDPNRKITVYLPPGYEKSSQRYPVIYFLHGGIEKSPDSLFMAWWGIIRVLDSAISKGLIRPVIFVLPNSEVTHGPGFCFYTNSSLTGNWSDYIANDVVKYIDKKYRTIADRNSRGLCGHSGGGNGTFKIGMLHPDVFGALYALSPAVLTWSGEVGIDNPLFKTIDSFRNQYSIEEIFDDFFKRNDFTKFSKVVTASMARAYSPDEDGKTFLSAKMPVKYIGDSMVVDEETKKKWEPNFPINMIDTHLDALKSFNGLKLDWGRDDLNIPAASLEFSKKLEANGIKHFAEEYIGDHVNNIGWFEGRIYAELLPFFNTYLIFDNNIDRK